MRYNCGVSLDSISLMTIKIRRENDEKLVILSLALLMTGCTVANFQYTPEGDFIAVTEAERIPMHLGDVSVEVAKNVPSEAFFFNLENKNKYESEFKLAFTQALQESLDQSQLFSGAKREVNLKATVLRFSQLSVGLHFPTVMEVNYQLVDSGTGRILFNQNIKTEAEAPLKVSYLGTARAIDARNLTAQQNIRQLLDALKKATIR